MGNNILCHLLSISYILGVSCFVLFYILLYFFFSSQNCIVTFYTEVIGMSQTRGYEGIQDQGNGVGNDLEMWKNIRSVCLTERDFR